MKKLAYIIFLLIIISCKESENATYKFYQKKEIETLNNRFEALESRFDSLLTKVGSKQQSKSSKNTKPKKSTTTVKRQGVNSANYNWQSRNTSPSTYEPAQHKTIRQSSSIRVGAICCDGTRSYATGRGACSHHGGVCQWLYN